MELRQTRDLTPAELHRIERDWALLLRRGMDDDRWYCAWGYLTYAFIGFLILSVIMAIFAVDEGRAYLASQLSVALAGCVLFWTAANRRARKLQRRIFWDRHRAGDRYTLTDSGIQIASPTWHYDLLWNAITNLADSDERLVLLAGNSGVAFIAKPAFSGQDVTGFCAELVRRWHANRSSPQREAST